MFNPSRIATSKVQNTNLYLLPIMELKVPRMCSYWYLVLPEYSRHLGDKTHNNWQKLWKAKLGLIIVSCWVDAQNELFFSTFHKVRPFYGVKYMFSYTQPGVFVYGVQFSLKWRLSDRCGSGTRASGTVLSGNPKTWPLWPILNISTLRQYPCIYHTALIFSKI